ncbi:MAG: hypothetical protein LBM13_02880, partial [Candidatus Ancillula sp.]|nr:hypothetical protein [Candidatus Ancillula sp.]
MKKILVLSVAVALAITSGISGFKILPKAEATEAINYTYAGSTCENLNNSGIQQLQVSAITGAGVTNNKRFYVSKKDGKCYEMHVITSNRQNLDGQFRITNLTNRDLNSSVLVVGSGGSAVGSIDGAGGGQVVEGSYTFPSHKTNNGVSYGNVSGSKNNIGAKDSYSYIGSSSTYNLSEPNSHSVIAYDGASAIRGGASGNPSYPNPNLQEFHQNGKIHVWYQAVLVATCTINRLSYYNGYFDAGFGGAGSSGNGTNGEVNTGSGCPKGYHPTAPHSMDRTVPNERGPRAIGGNSGSGTKSEIFDNNSLTGLSQDIEFGHGGSGGSKIDTGDAMHDALVSSVGWAYNLQQGHGYNNSGVGEAYEHHTGGSIGASNAHNVSNVINGGGCTVGLANTGQGGGAGCDGAAGVIVTKTEFLPDSHVTGKILSGNDSGKTSVNQEDWNSMTYGYNPDLHHRYIQVSNDKNLQDARITGIRLLSGTSDFRIACDGRALPTDDDYLTVGSGQTINTGCYIEPKDMSNPGTYNGEVAIYYENDYDGANTRTTSLLTDAPNQGGHFLQYTVQQG